MENNLSYYRIHDPRLYEEEGLFDKDNPRANKNLVWWRQRLRFKLIRRFLGRSPLTQQSLETGYELHESIFPRRYIPSTVDWHWMIHSGPNSMLLPPEEHRPDPPDRVLGYWIACIYFRREIVDQWIDSLPFKVRPDTPWAGTDPEEELSRIPEKYKVDKTWDVWLINSLHTLRILDKRDQ